MAHLEPRDATFDHAAGGFNGGIEQPLVKRPDSSESHSNRAARAIARLKLRKLERQREAEKERAKQRELVASMLVIKAPKEVMEGISDYQAACERSLQAILKSMKFRFHLPHKRAPTGTLGTSSS